MERSVIRRELAKIFMDFLKLELVTALKFSIKQFFQFSFSHTSFHIYIPHGFYLHISLCMFINLYF